MNTTELRRRRFFDALARVLVFALFIVLFVAAVVLAPAALLTGCAAPGEPLPGAIDFVTNAAQRAVVVLREARERPDAPDAPEPPAPPNEWWRTFPETEEEYLALCEPKIQEKLLDYPEEERENVREALLSEASTVYLFKSIYAELMRAEENAESGALSGSPGSDSPSTTEHAEDAEGASTSSQTPVTSASSVVLDFRHGGVRASPTEDPRCRISKLRIGGDSLSFHWDTGIPSDWKRGDTKKGPMVLACAFYFDDASEHWIGGKFDWIDEHRSGRSLENIHGGYGGWNAGAWNAAKRRAFCVVSADGKYRSNLLED